MALRKPLIIIAGQIQELPAGDSVASTPYPWCVFRNDIAVGETATINSNQFLLGLETFSIDGTLDNNGRMLVL